MNKRPLCSHCGLPCSSCLCGWIRPTDNPLPVLILQHPQESTQAKGSVRLLRLSLSFCRCEVGDVFEPDRLAQWLTQSPRFGAVSSVLVYPAPVGRVTEPVPVNSEKAPTRQLVLLDGTWRQSRQLLQRNPALQALPRMPLMGPPPGRYLLRKAQRSEHRSSLEAACTALATLDPQAGRYAALLSAFDGWVAQCLARVQ